MRFHIVTVLGNFVTVSIRKRVRFCALLRSLAFGLVIFILGSSAIAQARDLGISRSGPLLLPREKFASILWEGGDDVSPPSHAFPRFVEPAEETSGGLPISEQAGAIEVAPDVERQPAPEKAAAEPVVSENGKVQLPSPEKLASELGYKMTEFKRFTEDFGSAISQGPRSVAFRRLCARDEESCRLLADFQAQAADAKRERRRERHKVKRFRISEANVSQAQRFEFQVLANNLRIENAERLFSLGESSLKEVECPRNLSAALAIKAEEYFPDIKARVLSRELFDHARHCLTAGDDPYERLFLRFGLYAYYDGNKLRARELLLEAGKATNPSERYRVLYWLGRIAFESEENKGKDNEYWTELMNQFPLSYYAIDVAVALHRDPMEMITQRKVGGLKREAQNDPELNRMIRWLEALYTYKQSNAVAKWASWIVRANEGELDVDILLYLSSLKIASGLYRSNIQMLFSYFRKNPAALNTEGLKLLYPRPYYDLIQEASRGKIDSFLVLGLIRQESGFDARAVSRMKAKGLMQIIPKTARKLASQGHKKLLNEKENTKMGVKYLLQLSDEFDGNVELVLAAYNAGPHRVLDWLKRNPDRKGNPLLWNDLIPFMETRDYVVSILRNNYLYLRLYGAKDEDTGKLFSSELVRTLLSNTH